MTLDSMKIGHRLALGYASVLACVVALTALAGFSLVAADRATARIVAMQNRAALAEEWLANTQLNVNRMLAIARSGNHPGVDGHFKPLMAKTSERITELQQSLEREVSSERGKALLAVIVQRRADYIATRKGIVETLQGGDAAATTQALEQRLMPAAEQYMQSMVELQAYQRQLVDQAIATSSATVSRQLALVLALCGGAVVVAGCAAWVITRSVTQPVQQALVVASAVARGDLTQTVTTTRRDELGALLGALAAMRDSLLRTVGEVRSTTDSIHTASAEIASGNLDLSARTEQAASNLQQTAASMEQITSTVQQSADSARQAQQLAAGAAAVAVRGGAVVGEVMGMMAKISTSSRRIADIIGTIDGIAFQTNILALNAAVEAARAGEQGRGFAVVAAEVRTLAQRSAAAAKEIKMLITQSVENVDAGNRLAAQAGGTMDEIVSSVQRVSDIIGEITAAAAEQSSGIGQVNSAVGELDRMTQQNSALVEQSAAAAASLKDQAGRLAEVVQVFRVQQAGA